MLREKLEAIGELWSPRVAAGQNDYRLKLEGEFVWHDHADTDEAFIVLGGRRLRGRS